MIVQLASHTVPTDNNDPDANFGITCVNVADGGNVSTGRCVWPCDWMMCPDGTSAPMLGCIDVGACIDNFPTSLASRKVLVAPISALTVMISFEEFVGGADTTGLQKVDDCVAKINDYKLATLLVCIFVVLPPTQALRGLQRSSLPPSLF